MTSRKSPLTEALTDSQVDALISVLIKSGKKISVTFSMVVGAVVFSLRQAQGLNQTTFAKAADLTQSIISRLENNKTDINVNQLRDVAKALGCNTHDIVVIAENICEKLEQQGIEVIPKREETATQISLLSSGIIDKIAKSYMAAIAVGKHGISEAVRRTKNLEKSQEK